LPGARQSLGQRNARSLPVVFRRRLYRSVARSFSILLLLQFPFSEPILVTSLPPNAGHKWLADTAPEFLERFPATIKQDPSKPIRIGNHHTIGKMITWGPQLKNQLGIISQWLRLSINPVNNNLHDHAKKCTLRSSVIFAKTILKLQQG
jgi:hypothetical protein